MKTVSLSGSPRENVGKKGANILRKDGSVPAGIRMAVFRPVYGWRYFGRPNDGSISAGLRKAVFRQA